MKALEILRQQLEKDYPHEAPVFVKAIKSPEEVKFFFDEIVIPAFEKIKTEFDSFHFEVNIKNFAVVCRLDIKDGCSNFSCAVKISRKYSAAYLIITYRDHSICSYNFKERVLIEERFDLSKIYQELPEELIINIFSDIFINRKTHLKRLIETERNDEQQKKELVREERRAKLIRLKTENKKFDPKDEFQKYLDSDEYLQMRDWLDYHFT